MKDSWLNHGVYPLLEMIGGFQNYFTRVCVWIAAICLLMSLLMMAVKIYLGVTNAREQVIKLIMTFCIYLFLMFIYPIAMKSILPFAMNLGYGAVMGSSNAVSYDSRFEDTKDIGGSKAGFFKWVGEHSGNIFTATEKNDPEGQKTQVYLDMNIVSKETGYLDLNKYILYVIALLRIGFKAFPKMSFFSIDLSLLFSAFLYFLGVLVACAAIIISSINYLMCLIDYFALSGFGVLTIPLSLWDGTKSYTEKLFSSIGSIIIKLMVISAFMCLGTFTVLDFFIDMYLEFNNKGFLDVKDSFKLVELAIGLIFRSFLLLTLTMNTEKIAGFINGGSPSMSIGEAAVGAGATAVLGGLAGHGAKGVVGGRKALGTSAAMGGAGAIAGHNMGGSALRSGFASAGHSLARSAGGALKSAPGEMKNLAQGMLNATGLSRGGDSAVTSGIGAMGPIGSFKTPSPASGGGGLSGGESGTSSDSGNVPSQSGNPSGGVNPSSQGQGVNSGGSDSSSNPLPDPNVIKTGDLESKITEKRSSGEYGDVNVNKDGSAGSAADSLIASANNSKGSALGFVQGTVGNVMKSLNNARLQREAGSVIGNERMSAVAGGLKAGVIGAAASTINSSGGLEVRFKSGSAMAKAVGSTHANVKVNNAGKTDKLSDGSKARSVLEIRGK